MWVFNLNLSYGGCGSIKLSLVAEILREHYWVGIFRKLKLSTSQNVVIGNRDD